MLSTSVVDRSLDTSSDHYTVVTELCVAGTATRRRRKEWVVPKGKPLPGAKGPPPPSEQEALFLRTLTPLLEGARVEAMTLEENVKDLQESLQLAVKVAGRPGWTRHPKRQAWWNEECWIAREQFRK